jgi:hypothetical protein
LLVPVDVQSTGETSSESEQESPQPLPSPQPVPSPTSKRAKTKKRAQDRARKQELASANNDVEASDEPQTQANNLEKSTEPHGGSSVAIDDPIITATISESEASLSVVSTTQIDTQMLTTPSASASVTSSDDEEEVETETGAEESAVESAVESTAPTIKDVPTPRPSFSHPPSAISPSRSRVDDKKQADHGKDHAPATRWRNAMVRTIWSLVMIGGFIGASCLWENGRCSR